ncbi:indolepyruvate oxidoreductase subunit beta [Infirmifilum lucidum]|uniref:Indolepyruvate oxidoreductase subunit beta n=1 Tax=Infirmifilum lucidum TaxID=2776706 RepID=A0A7L9FIC1_9CREN|nr:indolepyruvate oxidoreductase subunit beta [Infirmifilum lucidum]QOJ79540.1 indolepyruvate oxidoreductase subunit beta [Infirmifilum lucidum]
MSRRSVVIAGVGGQGLITIGSVLGEALMAKNYNVSVGEIHGLSQRGGSVAVFLKYGEGAVSPVVTQGEADLIVGLELIETVRRLPLLKRDGSVVVNDFLLPPPASKSIPTRGELLSNLSRVKSYVVDARELALKAGSEIAVNMVMLGAALATKILDLDIPDIENLLSKRFKGDVLRVNMEALRLGYQSIKE